MKNVLISSWAMNYVPGADICASQPDDALPPGTRVGVLLKERNDGNAYLAVYPAGIVQVKVLAAVLPIFAVVIDQLPSSVAVAALYAIVGSELNVYVVLAKVTLLGVPAAGRASLESSVSVAICTAAYKDRAFAISAPAFALFRELVNVGMAIATRIAMMATTISISIRVKPFFEDFLVFRDFIVLFNIIIPPCCYFSSG
jgi:hypothetical protein